MTTYHAFTLKNSLQVLIHPEPDSQQVFLNLMYKTGSFHDSPTTRGLAHLAEHMMFSGSKHIPDYQEALKKIGGRSNAFTTFDTTQYILALPKANLEGALWLASDLLLYPNMQADKLAIQRKVVVEEFKQVCFNAPYGDALHHLLDLAYTAHPYNTHVIGKSLADIETITLADVQAFSEKYHTPANARLVISGDVVDAEVEKLVRKWFEEGETQPLPPTLPPIPPSTKRKGVKKTSTGDVPASLLTQGYHTASRDDETFLPTALLLYLLFHGESSLLHKKLVDELAWVSNINSMASHSFYGGLLIVQTHLQPEISYAQVEGVIAEVITDIQEKGPSEEALQSVKSQLTSDFNLSYNNLTSLNTNLAYGSWLGDPLFFEKEIKVQLPTITATDIQEVAKTLLTPAERVTLYYSPKE